jgi:hypothetical protein
MIATRSNSTSTASARYTTWARSGCRFGSGGHNANMMQEAHAPGIADARSRIDGLQRSQRTSLARPRRIAPPGLQESQKRHIALSCARSRISVDMCR